MTAIPLIEKQAGDISAYIPTNVISITDGQIFLESELFFSGQRPAINAGISVSRVGGKAQIKAMKKVSSKIKLILSQYRELQSFAQFGSDVDPATKKSLEHGATLMQILRQPQYQPLDVADQVMILYAAVHDMLDEVPNERMSQFEEEFYPYMNDRYPEIAQEIHETGDLTENAETSLVKGIQAFKEKFKKEYAQ